MTKLMAPQRMDMRAIVTLDDGLLAQAQQLCGDLERSALLREALQALVQRESARRWRRWAALNPICSPFPVAAVSLDPGRPVGVAGSPARRQVLAAELGVGCGDGLSD